MASTSKKTETGKHGVWDTRPNPFTRTANNAPKACFGDVHGLGVALDKVLSAGCAIMFGRTRDGGALVLTVLDGEQRHRTYCSNQSELDLAIEGIELAYTDD